MMGRSCSPMGSSWGLPRRWDCGGLQHSLGVASATDAWWLCGTGVPQFQRKIPGGFSRNPMEIWKTILGESYMDTLILQPFGINGNIYVHQQRFFFFAGYLRLAMKTRNKRLDEFLLDTVQDRHWTGFHVKWNRGVRTAHRFGSFLYCPFLFLIFWVRNRDKYGFREVLTLDQPPGLQKSASVRNRWAIRFVGTRSMLFFFSLRKFSFD